MRNGVELTVILLILPLLKSVKHSPQMNIKKLFILLLFFAFYDCKETCGSAGDGVLNIMTFSVVVGQIIINVVNALNNNNNNNNDNNNK